MLDIFKNLEKLQENARKECLLHYISLKPIKDKNSILKIKRSQPTKQKIIAENILKRRDAKLSLV